MYVYICYIKPRVLYHIYKHRARGRGNYKCDTARVGVI